AQAKRRERITGNLLGPVGRADGPIDQCPETGEQRRDGDDHHQVDSEFARCHGCEKSGKGGGLTPKQASRACTQTVGRSGKFSMRSGSTCCRSFPRSAGIQPEALRASRSRRLPRRSEGTIVSLWVRERRCFKPAAFSLIMRPCFSRYGNEH